jgi:hypothetical protein
MAKRIVSNHIGLERPAIVVFYIALTLLLGGVWGAAIDSGVL